MIADLGRIARHGQHMPEAERAEPHDLRLQPEQVTVAAGDVQERCDADFLAQMNRGG
jgi:hypothetical protein